VGRVGARIRAALLLGLVVVGLTAGVASGGSAPVPPPVGCGGYLVWAGRPGEPSTFGRWDPDTGRRVPVATLPWRVNALGYDPGHERFYGLTEGPGRPHAVTVSVDGAYRDLGVAPVWSYVGTVAGGHWYLLVGTEVVTLDLALRVTGRVRLSRPVRVGDWDVDPGTGRLVAVSNLNPVAPEVVAIDPVTGTVTGLGAPKGLAGIALYGAAYIRDGYLYVLNNGYRQWVSRGYRIKLDGVPTAEPLGTGPAVESADAAAGPACASPSPSASPSVSRSPSPSPSPSPSRSRCPSASPSAPSLSPPPPPPPPLPPVVVPPVVLPPVPPVEPDLGDLTGLVPAPGAPPQTASPAAVPSSVAPARGRRTVALLPRRTPDRTVTHRWMAALVGLLAMTGLLASRVGRAAARGRR
jgi:hypothetical protein